MNNYTNQAELPQGFAAQQPKMTFALVQRPPHDAPHPLPLTAAELEQWYKGVAALRAKTREI